MKLQNCGSIIFICLPLFSVYCSVCSAFSARSISKKRSARHIAHEWRNIRTHLNVELGNSNESSPTRSPIASLVGYISSDQFVELESILIKVGYDRVIRDESSFSMGDEFIFKYKYVKASGMLKLIEDGSTPNDAEAPRYIPVQSGEENVLVANGWSFLDPDEAEPISAFDIDAANAEGQYKPKWGEDEFKNSGDNTGLKLSNLGFNLERLSKDSVLLEANRISSLSREVLLNGGTDKPNKKVTNNGHYFSGSVANLNPGLFTSAIGGNPLFTTNELSPLTASSGWLTFSRPISKDHIELVYAKKGAMDQRVEVIDAKTGCHLGHYFGEDGYCINASALNFFLLTISDEEQWNDDTNPVSWQNLRRLDDKLNVSSRILKTILLQNINSQEILLGAGCFWHVEFALRRLPGVVDTKVGYTGGTLTYPSYEDVCKKDTGHAEVVKVTFDPSVLNLRKLIDCFLAMHDPTIVRAHGERAVKIGQYRSCVFVSDKEMEKIANDAVTECRKQLAKILSTEVKSLPMESSFWLAEEHHQLHDERVKKKVGNELITLNEIDWLFEYGRRSSSIWGSSETAPVEFDDSEDDGMARMMI